MMLHNEPFVRCVSVKESQFGPSFIKQYNYIFQHTLYSVLLNTNETCFDCFVKNIQNNIHNIPNIQNRVIQSSTLDVHKFNRFFGLFCDFYTCIPGSRIPVNISFFSKFENIQEHRVLDTMGVWHTYTNDTLLSVILTEWIKQAGWTVEKKHTLD